MSQKSKYLTKVVKFGNKSLTLYSLDGLTWSSRRAELQAIKERQEANRVTFAEIKGETQEAEDKEESEEKEEGAVELKVSDEEEGTATKKGKAKPTKDAARVVPPKNVKTKAPPKKREMGKPVKKDLKLKKKAA